jgi:hypothetical protein
MAKITNVGVHIVEGSAAAADTGGEGQIWVKSDTPSSLYYTDDAGTDFRMGGITLGTSVATTSGTTVTYTSIPPGVKRIIVMGIEVSTNGTAEIRTQLGTSGGLVTSGYSSIIVGLNSGGVAVETATNSLLLAEGVGASEIRDFTQILSLVDASRDEWVSSVTGARDQSQTECFCGGGHVDLGGDVTQLKIFMDGSDAFDAGRINIQFE